MTKDDDQIAKALFRVLISTKRSLITDDVLHRLADKLLSFSTDENNSRQIIVCKILS